MKPNDNDIIINNMPPVFDNGSNNINQEESGTFTPWKMVSVGGVGGLLVGAGAMYATSALASNNGASDDTEDALAGVSSTIGNMAETIEEKAENEDSKETKVSSGKSDTKDIAGDSKSVEVEKVTVVEHVTVVHHENAPIYQDAPIAYNVNDHMSFSEAFAAARAEVGPGGVFSWHGGVYGTYYENEWNQMNNSERNLYAQSVHTEYNVSQVDTHNLADAQNPHVDVNVHVITHYDDIQDVNGTTYFTDVQADHITLDVDGETFDVYTTDVNGQTVAYVDIDNDGLPDLAMSDINNNGIPDTGEVLDINSGEYLDMPHSDINLNDTAFDDASGFTIETDVNLI